MEWGDGAGFINDSVADDPHQVTSSVSVAGDDRNKLVAAVSVSQVAKLTRPNDGLIIHGKKIYHVNLVGYVYEIVDMNQTKIHVMIDDHSGGGPLEVSHILGDTGSPGDNPELAMFDDHMAESNPGEPRKIHSIQVGDYIRVIGVVKFNQDKANVVAYNIRILDDPNEITMHIMEVIRDALFYQKVQATGGVLPMSVKDENRPMGQNNNHQQMNTGVSSALGQLPTRDKHVMTFLKTRVGEDGMHIDNIVKNFTAFGREEIIQSLTALSQEGHCWTGEDENYWCCDGKIKNT